MVMSLLILCVFCEWPVHTLCLVFLLYLYPFSNLFIENILDIFSFSEHAIFAWLMESPDVEKLFFSLPIAYICFLGLL